MSREEDQTRLTEAMADRAGVATLVGPPGVGKSWLARRLAVRMQGTICALAEATSASEVLTALSAALGAMARRQDDAASFADWLVECARDRPLVVLDDVDGALGPVAELASRWLAAGVRTPLVVTAREPLRIPEERRVAIAPLAPDEATQLFLERARAVHGRAAVAEADLPLLPEVVAALDGLPLAIELAVSRLDAVDLRTLHRSLGHHLDLLRSGFRSVPARHGSLRMAFADTFASLDALPQRLLATATHFRGGFLRDDLLAVAAPEARDDARLEAFGVLRRCSLLHATPDGRFHLLHVVRELAHEHLAATPTAGAPALAHAAHFAALALRAEPASPQEPTVALRAERENLLAALRVARAPETSAPLLVLALARGLHPLLTVAGPRALHLEILDLALAGAEHDGTPLDHAHARLRHAEAVLQWDGAQDAALRDLELAASTFRERHDVVGLSRALLASARALLGLGRFDEWQLVADEALRTARDTGDAALVARALRMHARRSLEVDAARSEALLREALPLVPDETSPATRAELLAELGRARLNAGDFAEAATHAAAALALHERLASPLEATIVRLDLALPLWQLGDADEARRLLAQAIEEARAQRAGRLEGFFLGYLGICEAVHGDVEVALHALPLAVERMDEHGDVRFSLLFRAWWSAAAASTGDLDAARAIAAPVRAVARPLHHEHATDDLLAYAAGTPPAPRPPATFEERLVAQLAARARATHASHVAPPLPFAAALQVQRDGFFYVLPDGARVELDKRPVLRRVLASITRRSIEGVRATLEEVIADGWPGERIRPDAAAHRAYMAISTLRRLGLRDRLQSTGDGYELLGAVELVDAR